ncbi:MAG: hypothetical protein LiPW15_302 [Parcubacteria group bacterium LiPW_15]|nr:MAG: hypothetical protein LiPW15_302 [Parcubacteria group bacterium LiPW_15]
MSFKMHVVNVITTLVETALPRFSGEKKLLYVLIEAGVTKEKVAVPSHRRFIHLLFHRPGNHTAVMVAVTDNPHFRKEEMKDWRVVSCHDSCWRSDGVESPLSKLYFEMCKEVDSAAAPRDLWATAQFSIFDSPKVVEVKKFTHDRENFIAHIEW